MEPDGIGIRVIRRSARVAAAALACIVGLAAVPVADEPKPVSPVRAWDCPARGIVTDAAISPDEKIVAYGSIEQLPAAEKGTAHFQEVIRLVNFHNSCKPADPASRPQPVPRLEDLPRILYDMQFSADGRLLAYADGTAAYVVHAPELRRVWKTEIPISDHGTLIPAISVARDAPVAAVLARPFRLPPPATGPQLVKRPEFLNLLRIYDLNSGAVRCDVKIPGEVRAVAVALSADGSRAAVMLRPDQSIRETPDLVFVDASTCKTLHSVRAGVNGPIESVGDAVWSLDASADFLTRSFHLIRFDDARVERQIDSPAQRVPAGLAVSGDGNYIASSLWRANGMVPDVFAFGQSYGGDQAEVGVWDAHSGVIVGQAVTSRSLLKLSSSGRFLLSGTRILEFDFASQSKTGKP